MRLLREWRRRDGGGGEFFRVQLGLRLELGLRIYSELAMGMGRGDGDGDSPAPAETGMNPRGY
jgi:hypothetical protein